MRVRFADEVARDERLRLLATLQELNVTFEGVNAIHFALDLPPATSEDTVVARLELWLAEGWAEYETCEARVAGSFDDVPSENSD